MHKLWLYDRRDLLRLCTAKQNNKLQHSSDESYILNAIVKRLLQTRKIQNKLVVLKKKFARAKQLVHVIFN